MLLRWLRFHTDSLVSGIGDVTRDIVAEFFQRVRAFDSQKAAAVRVGIDVGDGVLAQFVVVRFRPLCGAEQAGLFAVPRAIDDGALGLPARFSSSPRPRASSSSATMPEVGSSAPFTHAS